MTSGKWDVVIVGAGPAGLSAALVLGRCCRRVLVLDDGQPRSWASHEMHGFLSRDPIAPTDFREIAHEQMRRYENVVLEHAQVSDITRADATTFRIEVNQNRVERARKVLIATGVTDQLPPLKNIERYWGSSVHQCPYCDGWELRGEPIAVYGKRDRGFEMARSLTAWTKDIALVTDGPSGLSVEQRHHLTVNSVQLIEERIDRLEGEGTQLTAVIFSDGCVLPRRALFFDTPIVPNSKLARQLGCVVTRRGMIKCGRYEASDVPGVFVAGNVTGDVQLAIVAAAEGTRAAFGINRSLTREDFDGRSTGVEHVEHPEPKENDRTARQA